MIPQPDLDALAVRIAFSTFIPLLLLATARADQPPAAGPALPAAPVPVYTLDDCLAIGRANQPTLRAAQASLASAQAAQRGLDGIRFGSLLAKDLPIRRQQAAHGVCAAAANLRQVERDVDCAVARLYYSVNYAREQKKVADGIVLILKATVNSGEIMLGKEGAPPDLNPVQLAKARSYLAMADRRVTEATQGLGRATAGLREAMGLDSKAGAFQVAETPLPDPLPGVNRDQIIALAVALRGEVGQANSGAAITTLEIEAQAKRRTVRLPTAASGGDVHARPVPTGSFGDDYKPGAIGLDFPSTFVGPRSARVERATEVAARAGAVVEKTRNLMALDAEDAYLRWEAAFTSIGKLRPAVADAAAIAAKLKPELVQEGNVSYRDLLEMHVLAAQLRAQLNEALYQHAIALTELERVTAGGFAAGAAVKPAKP